MIHYSNYIVEVRKVQRRVSCMIHHSNYIYHKYISFRKCHSKTFKINSIKPNSIILFHHFLFFFLFQKSFRLFICSEEKSSASRIMHATSTCKKQEIQITVDSYWLFSGAYQKIQRRVSSLQIKQTWAEEVSFKLSNFQTFSGKLCSEFASFKVLT